MLQILDRITLLGKMSSVKLDWKNTKDYTVQQLMDACDKMEAYGAVYLGDDRDGRIQQELICNPLFADMYKKLSEKGVHGSTFQCWLEEGDHLADTLTSYTEEQLMKAFSIEKLNDVAKYEYLKYYSGETLEEDQECILLRSLRYISSHGGKCRIADLTEPQRKLLLRPFFEQYIVISKESWKELMTMLDNSPMIQESLEFLCQKEVEFSLDSSDLNQMVRLPSDTPQRIKHVYEILGEDEEWMSKFMRFWLRNGALEYELDWFGRRNGIPLTERDGILGTYIGYTNALYSGQLDIPFERVQTWQKDVLFYAIAHKKHHFLKLITENFEVFESLDSYVMLFDPEFYKRCNLNTLTCSNLEECRGNIRMQSHLEELAEREYTFAELKLLRYAAPVYRKLYNRLTIARVDERLIVMRQLLKNHLLPEELNEEQLDVLAGRLSQKPLSVWHERQFSHIKGVSMSDTLHFLLEFDILERFLPQMQEREEILYAIRNAGLLRIYPDWKQAREEIILVDRDFWKLREYMNLTDEFVLQNERHIKKFLLAEGAEMTRIYYEYTPQKEAFRRIVQAELMGKFKELKYFGDDLEKEISHPINAAQRENWKLNREMRRKEFEVREVDDFYTTLKVGLLPHRTCLSYKDGMHRDCVLAGYDSNKKILIAKKHGKIIGRAIIRLTKGRFHDSNHEPEKELEFVDLLTEGHPEQGSVKNNERLVLFLERPYFSHISLAEEEQVKSLFVDYVTEKASLLDAVPVLACVYAECYEKEQYVRMGYYIYISKSKSGAQYLDSLAGEATVTAEGSYKQNMLLILREAM